jgi:hypothetical protein
MGLGFLLSGFLLNIAVGAGTVLVLFLIIGLGMPKRAAVPSNRHARP